MTTTPDAHVTQAPASEDRYYGFSALVSGLAKMWRATVPAVIAIVANAIGQAALTAANTTVSFSVSFLAALAGSLLLVLLCGAILTSGAFESAVGRTSPAAVIGRARKQFPRYALWVAVLIVLCTAGSLVHPLLAVAIGWILVYLPIAAVSEHHNPIAANFAAIGRHPFRWLVTGVIVAVLLSFGFVLGALNTFFVGSWAASAAAMLIGGVFSWWFLTTWACLYRSR